MLIALYGCWTADKRIKNRKISYKWLFTVFLVLYITTFRREPQEQLIRIIPFETITLRTIYTDFLNILLFLPFGYGIYEMNASKKKLKRLPINLMAGFMVSFAVEILQFVLRRGIFDTEDLIFNTIGAALGGLLYTSVHRWMDLKVNPSSK